MKRNIIALFIIMMTAGTACAQTKTVNLSKPGSLCSVLTAQEMEETRSITVTGKVSDTDVRFLRMMAKDYALSRIDMRDCEWMKEEPTDNVVFFDRNLKRLIIEKFPQTDPDHDGEITVEDALQVRKLDLSLTDRASAGEEMLVRRLEGMEYFRNIDSLSFENQPVKDMMPIRRMIKMEYLNMAGSDITRLDLSTMPVLTTFVCSRLSLTSLDFFYNGVITHIEAEKMPKLTDINLVNGTFQDTAQYNIAKGNDALKTVHCDIGKETEYVTSLFESRPDVEVVSE